MFMPLNNRLLKTMGRKRVLIVIGTVLFGIIPAIVWFWPSGTELGADPYNPAQVSLGHSVYVGSCAACHGENLEGQPNWRTRNEEGRLAAPPHDQSGHTWHHPNEVLFGIIKKGIAGYAPADYQSDMPAFDEILSDEEIWAVLAYIQSTWPEQTKSRHQARNKRNGG